MVLAQRRLFIWIVSVSDRMPSYIPSAVHTYSFPIQNISLTDLVVTQICLGNARRIALGIYSSYSTVSIFPTSAGVIMSQIQPYLAPAGGYWYLAKEVGSLTQIEWYAYCTVPSIITVLEVVEMD